MKCRQEVESFDVVVIGAGPGGTTVASYLIRAGLTVLLLEKQSFPRFHVGESLTGVAAEIIADFNLTDTVNSYDFPVKGGVKVIGKGAKNEFFVPVMRSTWQVRRAEFDRILLTHAKSQGVTYRQGHVKSVLKTGERVTGLTYGILEETDEGTRHVVTKTVHCQVVVDASGQSTVLSKLGVAGPRKKSDQFNNDVAVFAHYQGVERDPGTMGDNTFIFYSHIHHWSWFIPIASDKVSVGCVLPKNRLVQCGSPEETMNWGLENINPELKRRMHGHTPMGKVHVISNYSYEVRPFAGEGWICIGDSHQFIDPILSFGVSMAMSDARAASEAILQSLASGSFQAPFLQYCRRSETGQRAAHDIISYFWKYPTFFGYQMRGKLRQDIIRLLSGDIFQPEQFEAIKLIRQGLSSANDQVKAATDTSLGAMATSISVAIS